jgi:hypothetical protein
MATVNAFKITPVNTTPKTETLIQFILDETGSMGSCRSETISSFNEYIESQKTVNDGKSCLVSLSKFSVMNNSTFGFSTAYQSNVSRTRVVYGPTDVQKVDKLNMDTFVPAGMTNLYDAIGDTISNLDRTVGAHQDVLVVIMTDGGENASVEYKSDQIKTLIADRQAKGWTFVFLGANQDAWSVGSQMGLSKGQTMTYSTENMAGTMATLSSATTAYRSSRGMYSAENKSGTVETNFFGDK